MVLEGKSWVDAEKASRRVASLACWEIGLRNTGREKGKQEKLYKFAAGKQVPLLLGFPAVVTSHTSVRVFLLSPVGADRMVVHPTTLRPN